MKRWLDLWLWQDNWRLGRGKHLITSPALSLSIPIFLRESLPLILLIGDVTIMKRIRMHYGPGCLGKVLTPHSLTVLMGDVRRLQYVPAAASGMQGEKHDPSLRIDPVLGLKTNIGEEVHFNNLNSFDMPDICAPMSRWGGSNSPVWTCLQYVLSVHRFQICFTQCRTILLH